MHCCFCVFLCDVAVVFPVAGRPKEEADVRARTGGGAVAVAGRALGLSGLTQSCPASGRSGREGESAHFSSVCSLRIVFVKWPLPVIRSSTEWTEVFIFFLDSRA